MAERDASVEAVRGDMLRLRLLGDRCADCRMGCGGRCNVFVGDEAGVLELPRGAAEFSPGQRVCLTLDDRLLRRAAWSGYGHAWLGLVAGAAAGYLVAAIVGGPPDAWTFAGLLAGTFLAVFFSNPHLPAPQVSGPTTSDFRSHSEP